MHFHGMCAHSPLGDVSGIISEKSALPRGCLKCTQLVPLLRSRGVPVQKKKALGLGISETATQILAGRRGPFNVCLAMVLGLSVVGLLQTLWLEFSVCFPTIKVRDQCDGSLPTPRLQGQIRFPRCSVSPACGEFPTCGFRSKHDRSLLILCRPFSHPKNGGFSFPLPHTRRHPTKKGDPKGSLFLPGSGALLSGYPSNRSPPPRRLHGAVTTAKTRCRSTVWGAPFMELPLEPQESQQSALPTDRHETRIRSLGLGSPSKGMIDLPDSQLCFCSGVPVGSLSIFGHRWNIGRKLKQPDPTQQAPKTTNADHRQRTEPPTFNQPNSTNKRLKLTKTHSKRFSKLLQC